MSSKAEIMIRNNDDNILLGDDEEGKLLCICFKFSESPKVFLFPYSETYENIKKTYEIVTIFYNSLLREGEDKEIALRKCYDFTKDMLDSLCNTEIICSHSQ